MTYRKILQPYGNLSSCCYKFSSFSQKVKLSESVQKQAIEQSPFSFHKDPHFDVGSTFNSVINVRLNIICAKLYLSIVGHRQTCHCVNKHDPSDAMRNTISEIQSVARASIQFCLLQMMQHVAL